MKTKSFALLGPLMLALAAPAGAADSRVASSAASSASPVAAGVHASGAPGRTMLGSRTEEDLYAKREAASPDAKKYKGGDVIVITATTAVIILLVVIIIILI